MVAAGLGTRAVVAIWRRSKLIDEVRAHYLRLWGEPSRTARFDVFGHVVEVLKWDAERSPEQVNMYATAGASAYPLPQRDPTHRLEFFVGLAPAQDLIAKPLAKAALDPVLHGSDLDHGHSVTYPEPLWRGTQMNSVLILKPPRWIVPPLVAADGLHVAFMQVIPVFASEVAFKSGGRTDALLERWQAAHVAFWDPGRQPEPSPT